MARRVLVTGLNGAVGSAMRPALAERYELSALSRSGVSGLPAERVFRADISDFGAIRPAFEGIDTVVHLAADGGVNSSDGMDAPWEAMLQNNIIGTFNVLEAARQAGARRVVLASSGATIKGYENGSPYRELASGDPAIAPGTWEMITHESEPKPITLYGVSKLFAEDLGRYFVNTSEMSVICMRIGGCNAEDRPAPGRGQAIWLSHRDTRQMAIRCIEAPDTVRFDIFFFTSNNELGYRDLDHAREVIGYIPEDGARGQATVR